MIWTATLTLLALLGTVLLTLVGWGGPVAAMHLAFAVGILPLIFAAMIHFIPVLTRTGEPVRWIQALPSCLQVLGLVVFAIFLGDLPYAWLAVVITVDLVLTLCLLFWILRRVTACIGSPHPSWRWYAAALSCLLLALLAVGLQQLLPQQQMLLRGIHLHLNTLGLLGFAALGTLPVLMPTVLGQPDPSASLWLRRWWRPWAIAIVFLLAALVIQGILRIVLLVLATLIFLSVIATLILHWWHTFGWNALWRDGAAASLFAAAASLAVLLILGLLHGLGWIAARPSIATWATGFLLPLVSGALSQLLPVWAYPGLVTPARLALRKALVAHGRWRAVLFFGAACAFHFSFLSFGAVLALVGVLLFVSPALGFVLQRRVSERG